jgi:hypothetical protein
MPQSPRRSGLDPFGELHGHHEEIGYQNTYPPQKHQGGTERHPGLQEGGQTSQPSEELQADQEETEDAQEMPHWETESRAADRLQSREKASRKGKENPRRRGTVEEREARAEQIGTELAQVDRQEHRVGQRTGQPSQSHQTRQPVSRHRERDEASAEQRVRRAERKPRA